MIILLISFVSGFAERLVPEMISRTAPGIPTISPAAPSSHLAETIGAVVSASVSSAIAGAPLVNYSGYVSATIQWISEAQRTCAISLVFSEGHREGAVRLLIEDGEDKLEAHFTLECEPIGSPRDRVIQQFVVPTKGDFRTLDFEIHVPGDTDELWVQLYQSNSRLAVIEVEIPKLVSKTGG